MESWGGISSAEMRAIDENAEWLGVDRILLMENAGSSVARTVYQWLGGLAGKKIVVVCGTGNNGGDGFAAARHMAGLGAKVTVILLGDREKIRTPEARRNFEAIMRMRETIKFKNVKSLKDLEDVRGDVMEAEAIIDAIFGTGIKGEIREPWRSMINLINSAKGLRVAVDIPSGVNPDTGEVKDVAVDANLTITFHRPKLGLPAAGDYCGEVVVAPIGIPPEAELIMGPGDARLALNMMREELEVALLDNVSDDVVEILKMFNIRYRFGGDAEGRVVYLGRRSDLLNSCRDVSTIISLNLLDEKICMAAIIDWREAEDKLGLRADQPVGEVCDELTRKASDLDKVVYIYGGGTDFLSNGSRCKLSWVNRPLNEEGLNALIGLAIALTAYRVDPFRALTAAGYLAGHVSEHGLDSLMDEVNRLRS